MDVKQQLDRLDKFLPAKGFALVGVDDYEAAEDEIYAIGPYAREDEAVAEMNTRKKNNPEGLYMVLDPSGVKHSTQK